MPRVNLDQLTSYQHVFISPHLDDVALSCGGSVAACRSRGERVVVITLCTAMPEPDQLQDVARSWPPGLAPQDVSLRLQEDRRAMEILDVDYYWAGLYDAIYRMPEIYANSEKLFAPAHPEDSIITAITGLLTTLGKQLPEAVLHVPLGVGSHVDHLATCTASHLSTGWKEIRWYEDIPYVLQAPHAVQERLAQQPISLTPLQEDISPYFGRKVAAIEAYRSQVPMLFTSPYTIGDQLQAYAASMNSTMLVERAWTRVGSC